MNFRKIARVAHRTEVAARDAQAVKRGRIPQRTANRLMGKAVGRLMRGLWR